MSSFGFFHHIAKRSIAPQVLMCVYFLSRVLIPQLRNYTINIYILQEDFDLFTKYLQLKDPSFFLLFGDKKLSVRKSYENSILAYTFDLIPRNDYIL